MGRFAVRSPIFTANPATMAPTSGWISRNSAATSSRMELTNLAIEGVKLIRPRRINDARGYFVETWSRRTFGEAGVDVDFTQDNASFSAKRGTVRGLHFQKPPMVQSKLVRVVRGSIFDVAVDIRGGSQTFGRHVSVKLTAAAGEQLYIPVGFAHGFCTLEADTEVAYKISGFYSPEHDTGIAWDDPDLRIDWPLEGCDPTLSDRDRKLPRLADAGSPF
jgi:dTDP-4-dehydrorhamnose 3,5-epimerase